MKNIWMIVATVLFLASCSNTPEEKVAEKKLNKQVREIVVKEGENKGIADLTIDGMSCEVNCAAKIQETLSGLKGVTACKVDFENKTAHVEFDHTQLTDEALIAAVEDLNDHQYTVQKVEVEVTKVVPDADRK